ncbi:glycoside hydrolase family 13 protein [Lacticaseibacillus songhuajiangensis]|uniref:glycoside hydrolase family 13 protein n=1 Tax=Lacticaseibacillus songhuajiangensis TaxID=1296539 RepID=UPI000F797B54|nr:glycoside hydrolase family 13 protein [Lacticaseibacillus songhuajiangensis]
MNSAAFKHRPESEDAYLVDADHLQIRFHAAKDDLQSVELIYGDPYWTIPNASGETTFAYSHVPMVKISTGETHDHWEVTIGGPYRREQYLFAVMDQDGNREVFGDRGLRADTEENRLTMTNYFRIPYFHVIDMVQTPEWVKDTVWYQIFPERFANGDRSNDPAGTKPWRPEDHPGREDFYGGDLQGVLNHLDDLQELGVNGLYFCPVFTASSNHKYDTIDYLAIDPAFGDKALFAHLVTEAHRRGMKVMLDAVFNHMGYESMQWQDVLRNGAQSRFADWFHIHEFPLTPFRDPIKGEGEPQFDTFGFEPHMPKLNTANPEVQAYLLEVATYWIREFDIDAWRLDVANEVDHHFWKQFYTAVTAVKPDFYVLGEVWHSSQSWLNGDEFSGVMNYAYTQLVMDHFLTGEQSAGQMLARLADQLMLYRDQTNQVMLNMLDSHDTARILTLAGDNFDLALQTLAFVFVQTGAPCIYYGTEMGMDGANDPDDRRPMDWSQLGGLQWQRVAALIHMRRSHARILGRGATHFELTATGLIRVRRGSSHGIEAYFNTTKTAVKVDATALLEQGFTASELQPNGFVIAEY